MPEKEEGKSDYRSIFKATSLFGGVQIWKILIQLIQQKAIAILLGPVGMGISGLYASSLNFIQGLTALGLSQSAVRDVAEANASGNQERISGTVIALRRLVWVTGLFGLLVVVALSPILSNMAFGNYDYAIPFAILSVTLLFQQISVGQSVILQGMRKLKWLALSGVYGSIGGLIISIPIYYFLRINGIVPTMVLNSILTLVISWYFSRKIKIEKISQTPRQTIEQGKTMLKMGIALSFNSVLVLGVAYILRIIISMIGGTEDVGLYTAGFAIIGGYTGLIFNAMSTDYYPRLSSVNHDNRQCTEIVNNQAELAILIITPLIILFVILADFAITLLYSSEFKEIVTYTRYAMVGMLFKAASWAISFVFLAKSDMKIFLFNEIFIKIINVPLYIASYYYYGFDGLGIAFCINYLIYLCLCYFNANRRYGFLYNRNFFKIFAVELLLACASLVFICLVKGIASYLLCIFILLITCYYSFRELDARLNILQFVKSKIQK